MEGRDGKTERATPKRRSEEREKGRLAVSSEVVSVVSVFASAVAVKYMAPGFLEKCTMLMNEISRALTVGQWSIAMVQDGFIKVGMLMAMMTAPLMLGLIGSSIAANIAQTGVYFELKPLEWKLSSVNPVGGFKTLFSMQSVVKLFFSLIKVLVIVYVLYLATRKSLPELTAVNYMSAGAFIKWTMMLVYSMTMKVVVLFIAVAVVDYAYQKRKYEKDMMMSKEEVKDENKQYEQNPIVKKTQRKKMRELSMHQMMAAVPRATVVVTNPTHVAIAIEYDPSSMEAPKVVAKGLRLVAQRIKDIARENGVPILERPELARALYKDVDIGKEIPSKFYEAVAEILAYLHKLGRRVFDIATEQKPAASR